jgi:hypothetical protein
MKRPNVPQPVHRAPSVFLMVLLALAWLVAFGQSATMQTRMAIGQLYAAADICIGSSHFAPSAAKDWRVSQSASSENAAAGLFYKTAKAKGDVDASPDATSGVNAGGSVGGGTEDSAVTNAGDKSGTNSGANHQGHHCAACLPALDASIPVSAPAYASWAERLSHVQGVRSIPSQSVYASPRPFGQGPPRLIA